MADQSRPSWVHSARRLTALTVLAVLITLLGRIVLPWDNMFNDVLCYWAAGNILASGQSPYDRDLQTRVQREYGWDKEKSGLGIYDFLPYYYPPWFGMLWVPLVPLGYQGARLAWFFLNVEMALVTGYLLRRAVPGVPWCIPLVLVPVFLFTVISALAGQTAILIFFLVALAWRLLQQGRDRSAGVVLAWLTIKPQLTAVLILAVLVWLLRQKRWGAVMSFFVALAVLCLASTLVVPSWPVQMLEAPRLTPAPTEYYPWIGNSWFLLLKTVGLSGWVLWALYLAAALPFLGAVLRDAFDRTSPLSGPLAASLLAAFVVAPYARHYDFPVLLIPALLLLEKRLPRLAGAALVAALATIPYAQLFVLAKIKELQNPYFMLVSESTFFWIPALLTVLWFIAGRGWRFRRASPPPEASEPSPSRAG